GSAGTAQRSASMPRPAAVEESPREAEADAAEVLPIENLVFEVRVAAGDRELRQEPCALGSGAQSERFGASRNRAELRTALECACNGTLQGLRGKNGINRKVLRQRGCAIELFTEPAVVGRIGEGKPVFGPNPLLLCIGEGDACGQKVVARHELAFDHLLNVADVRTQ